MTRGKASRKSPSGSPVNGEPEYLVVGSLRRPHGVKGELLMAVFTDFPERLAEGVEVFVGKQHKPATIVSRRPHQRGLLIKFEGVDTPEAAGVFRNCDVYVRASGRPTLPAGYYYHHELQGCLVVDESGTELGTLSEVLQTGANDVYVVLRDDGHELLLPAISSVVLEVDLEHRCIRVRPPEELVESDS